MFNSVLQSVVLIAIMIGSSANVAVDDSSSRPVTEADCVFATYVEDWSLSSNRAPQLIVGIWNDGEVIWSEDQERGGAPYRSARLAPNTLGNLLKRMRHNGVFANAQLSRSWAAWDSEFVTILARSRGQEIRMRLGKRPAVTGSGDEFERFVDVWKELRRQSTALIPGDGRPIAGELISDHGKIRWEHSSVGGSQK